MVLVDNLLNLYRVDAQVRSLRSRLTSAQRYLDAQARLLNELQQQQQELATRRKHLQATIGTHEVELKAVDERLEKLRTELNSSVSNKQYTAVLNELTGIKTQRGEIEDRMLQIMQQVETIETQSADVAKQMAERTRMVEHARGQLAERQADVGQRLSELEAERKAAAAVIPAPELAIFEDMADDFEGEVMAAVEEIDRRRREYACGACNMQLPLEQVLNLTARSETLQHCPSCNRILYMQEEVRGSLAKK